MFPDVNDTLRWFPISPLLDLFLRSPSLSLSLFVVVESRHSTFGTYNIGICVNSGELRGIGLGEGKELSSDRLQVGRI